ncbi:hypothetical protein AB4Z51_43250 [Bradyrhizobium sp. 2TAF36]|uniref:hypothetical protein n=1 Tax=Bradyrhizobium sp. 2TAF36 TaxID=3233016 RepID=UPI003F90C04D
MQANVVPPQLLPKIVTFALLQLSIASTIGIISNCELAFAQTGDGVYGTWSDSPDKKTCNVPLGSSPDVATIYKISQKGIFFYEIDCAPRDLAYHNDGIDFELDCFKGGGARWFEKASARVVGASRITLRFSDRKPPIGSGSRVETLYRCSSVSITDTERSKAVVTEWRHNGSVMSLSEEGSNLEIAYMQPRPGILAVGVRAKTTLFLGQRDGVQVEGTAYIFHPNCGPIGYQVKGQFLEGERALYLTGMSPRMTPSCEVGKEVPEALRFERVH